MSHRTMDPGMYGLAACRAIDFLGSVRRGIVPVLILVGATATTLLPVPVAFFAAAVAMVLFRVIPGARGLCGHRWTDPGGARSPHPSQRFPQNHRRHGRHRGMACEVRFCPAAGRRIPSSVLQSKRAGNKHIYQCDISVADSSLFFSVAFGPLRRLRVLALSFAGCLVGVGQARTLAFHNFIGDGLEATGSLVIPSPFALLTRSVVGVHERQRSRRLLFPKQP